MNLFNRKKINEEAEKISKNTYVSKKDALNLLRESNGKIIDGSITSFVKLRNVNKVYPNGIQAVYDFNLDVNPKEFVVIVGPSGCGKSTTLRMIAGLEDITTGYLFIDKVLANYLSSKDRNISMVFQSYALYPQMTVFDNIAFPLKMRTYPRPLIDEVLRDASEVKQIFNGNLFQVTQAIKEAHDPNRNKGSVKNYVSTYLKISNNASKTILDLKAKDTNELIAHKEEVLKAQDQIIADEMAKIKGEGKRVNDKFEFLDEKGQVIINDTKLSKEEIEQKVFWAASMLDLGPYLDRRPKELSGGQMQRVALGRAIVRNAKLFLMDEPLSNLDAKLRVSMRSEIVKLHEKIGATTIYVTHDQTEAMTMADKIVVMSKGWVQQIGSPSEIYSHPRNIFVATFIGSPAMNILPAVYDKGYVMLKDGFSFKLPENFNVSYKKFYEDKIKQCQEIIEILTRTNEDEAIRLLETLNENNLMENLGKVNSLINSLSDLKPMKEMAKTAIETLMTEAGKAESKKTLANLTFRKHVHDFIGSLKADIILPPNLLSILHSSVAFGDILKDGNKLTKDSEDKAQETLSYGGRKHEWFFEKWIKNYRMKKSANRKLVNPIENPLELTRNLLANFEKALIGPSKIKLGIRPELLKVGREEGETNVKILSNIVENLGNNLLVHGFFEDQEIIASSAASNEVSSHTEIDMHFNPKDVHIFDASSGSTIE